MRNLPMKPTCMCVGLLCLPLGFVALPGCGTNYEDVLFQVASAAGRTAVDLFVTDVVNTVAGVEDVDNSVDEDATDDTDGADNGGGVVDLDSLVGDAVAGQDIFTVNNCGACHCADGIGGCALDAPTVIGVATSVTDEVLRGGDPHAGGKFSLSDQELVDLAAFMASL